jgi:glycosyl transferase family 2
MISLVVPTYKERQNIPQLVQRVQTTLTAVGQEFELIVVDDDSPDGTAEEVRGLQAGRPWLRLLARENERDLSTAVVAGWRIACGEVLGCMDGDLQHPPEVLPRLLERMRTTGVRRGYQRLEFAPPFHFLDRHVDGPLSPAGNSQQGPRPDVGFLPAAPVRAGRCHTESDWVQDPARGARQRQLPSRGRGPVHFRRQVEGRQQDGPFHRPEVSGPLDAHLAREGAGRPVGEVRLGGFAKGCGELPRFSLSTSSRPDTSCLFPQWAEAGCPW